ncbi:hypothetical protein L7F22_030816 [Adiantum nelumboides]|nr:hypothetical protein [Adiantum nelumboides]
MTCKQDFHMDKETEATFQRFQDGVSLVKADQKLFKGLFYMAIKDVDAADVEDLKSEFFTKISYICSKSNDNFLVTMYNGQACVAALPPFQRPEFQESISGIGFAVQEITATHKSGRCFMEDFKLVLSQISVRDWSSVDSKRVAMRLTVLRNHLESAIRVGQCSDGQCLLDFRKDENIADEPISVGGKFDSLIQDAGLELAGVENDSSKAQVILQPLKQKFESIVQHQDGIDNKWHDMYQSFLDSLMERRQTRVLEWLEVNTLDFKEDTDMQKLVHKAATKLLDMRHKIQLCTCKCTKCFLLCLLLKGHTLDHSCLGSHLCMQECSYCYEEAEVSGQMILECNDLAGHNGTHDCKKRTHTCEEPCMFAGCASNCNRICSLRVNHLGDHRCNSIQHMCKEKCALHGCHNACIVPFELGQHERHGCHEKVCPMQCSMMGCTRTCVTQDHFHDLEAGTQHFCAHEHPCPSKCESPGVCYVHTELLKQTRSFHGKRSDFEYDYVSEQSEERKGCCLMVPPFMCSHKGSHTHSTNVNVLHYCNVRCPACDYYCQLPFGHAGLHKTAHGNMRKMRFVAEVEEIDVQDRKYVRGESGVAEMCMMHCKARGRGHTHLAPCPEKAGSGCCIEKLYDGARHLINTKCEGLDVKKPLDELTHETYWEYIRFVDPCEEAEKESFALCNHLCRSDEHNTENSHLGKPYCTEKLWHVPVPRAGAFQTGAGGYVTEDGHHFTCNHAKMSPHNVIFVMDKSGSMASGQCSNKAGTAIDWGAFMRLFSDS